MKREEEDEKGTRVGEDDGQGSSEGGEGGCCVSDEDSARHHESDVERGVKGGKGGVKEGVESVG